MDALIQMTGYVGGDVTLRSTGGGVAVADFRLACTPRVLRNNQWVDADTTWLTVKAFRGLAENVAASVHRGEPVIVVGRLRTSTWVKDDQSYERLELEAASVGHDLSRGRANFHRKPPESEPTTGPTTGPAPGRTAEAAAEPDTAEPDGAEREPAPVW